jgi:hypothetical protein
MLLGIANRINGAPCSRTNNHAPQHVNFANVTCFMFVLFHPACGACRVAPCSPLIPTASHRSPHSLRSSPRPAPLRRPHTLGRLPTPRPYRTASPQLSRGRVSPRSPPHFPRPLLCPSLCHPPPISPRRKKSKMKYSYLVHLLHGGRHLRLPP